MGNGGDRIEPFSPRRRGTADYMRVAGHRSTVHGLVAVDVTEARRRLRAIEEETGERLSFTAFLTACLARAIDDHPEINAYRDWRGRVHVFDVVDGAPATRFVRRLTELVEDAYGIRTQDET